MKVHLAAVLLAISCGSASALEPPVIWRDPDTGCAYYLTPQGGMAPRYLRNGSPDCPDANTGSRFVDDAVRGLSKGLETLQRELEQLRQRFRDQPPSERLNGKI